MTLKKFITKTIRKIIVFTFAMVIIGSIMQSMSPVISNEMALTQMENSNEMFILMNTYNKVRPIVDVVYSGIIIFFVYTIGRDTYKFIKNYKNEKEN